MYMYVSYYNGSKRDDIDQCADDVEALKCMGVGTQYRIVNIGHDFSSMQQTFDEITIFRDFFRSSTSMLTNKFND